MREDDKLSAYGRMCGKTMNSGALRSYPSSLLERAEELFSAAQSPMEARWMLAQFQSRCAAAGLRRAVMLVLDNGAVSRNATK